MKNEKEQYNCFKGKNIFSLIKKKKSKENKTIALFNCIETLLSDPIVVLFTNNNYICAGTLTGRVTLFKIQKTENKGINTESSFANFENSLTSKGKQHTIKKKIEDFDKIEDFENLGDDEEGEEDDLTKDGIREKDGNWSDIHFSNNTYISEKGKDVIEGKRMKITSKAEECNKKDKCRIICMFRNNSIKSIYIDKQYMYIYYEHNIDIFSLSTYQFIKKISLDINNSKQIIFYKNFILFNNSKKLSIYDVTNNFMHYFLKNFLKNVIIFDFNINYILCYKNYFGKCHIRVLHILTDATMYSHELIFCVDFSSSSKFISHGKFIDDDKIIVAKNGNRLNIFDFKKAIDMYRIKKLKKKVLDIHKSENNMLFILVENMISIFNLTNYSFFKNIQLPQGLFYFKWPYFIRYVSEKIVFTTDRGVYYIEYPVRC